LRGCGRDDHKPSTFLWPNKGHGRWGATAPSSERCRNSLRHREGQGRGWSPRRTTYGGECGKSWSIDGLDRQQSRLYTPRWPPPMHLIDQ
jgi:hypothetical protein